MKTFLGLILMTSSLSYAKNNNLINPENFCHDLRSKFLELGSLETTTMKEIISLEGKDAQGANCSVTYSAFLKESDRLTTSDCFLTFKSMPDSGEMTFAPYPSYKVKSKSSDEEKLEMTLVYDTGVYLYGGHALPDIFPNRDKKVLKIKIDNSNSEFSYTEKSGGVILSTLNQSSCHIKY